MIEATIMIDEYVHPSEVQEFIKHLKRSFENVDYISEDKVIRIESKKDMNRDVFIQHCSGFERYMDAVSVHKVDTDKEGYWDELGADLGFVTADKYVSDM